jgi:hypothetical protein
MTDDARRRTAYHEAAHAVAGILYGRPIRVVSIRPGAQYRGTTLYESSTGLSEALAGVFDPSAPALLQPSETRTAIEREIVITLAGPTAGQWAHVTTGRIEPDPCEIDAEKAAAGLAALSPRHRELIVSEEVSDAERVGDEQAASNLSWALIGEPIEEVMHLAWLRAVTSNLVVRQWHQIEALANALLDRTVLDGATAAAIVTAAPRRKAT